MTTVIYKKSGVGYICREISSSLGGGTTIIVEGSRGGEISFLGERAKLEKGIAKFNAVPTVDGIYEPILHIGRKNIPLDRLCIRDGLIYTDPAYSARSKETEEMISNMKTELEKLSERIRLIEQAVFETKLF